MRRAGAIPSKLTADAALNEMEACIETQRSRRGILGGQCEHVGALPAYAAAGGARHPGFESGPGIAMGGPAFIVAQREDHGVPYAVSRSALGVSPSWYYKWRPGVLPSSARCRKRLDAEVAARFAARKGKDGAPWITSALREDGWAVSEKTVAALEHRLTDIRYRHARVTLNGAQNRWIWVLRDRRGPSHLPTA